MAFSEIEKNRKTSEECGLKMLKKAFQVTTILLAATIIFDLISTPSFQKSITYRYLKYVSFFQSGQMVFNYLHRVQKFSKFSTLTTQLKPYVRITYNWSVVLLKNAILLIQHLHKYLNNKIK